MANSWQTETAAPGQIQVSINIPYMQRQDIYLYVNGGEVKGFTWVSDTNVRLPAPLTGGEEILVMRRTEREHLRIQFSEGAAFDRSNLDEQNTQFLYLSQELVEGRSIEGFYGDISMNTFRITNLGSPIYDTDAANKKYVDAEVREVNQKAIRVPEATVQPTPTVNGRKNKLLGFDSIGNPVSATPIEGSATELELDLQDIDGMSILGRVPSIEALRQLAPRQDRRFVSVVGYVEGSVKGGGFFEYVASDTTSPDDGGIIIVGLNGARWRRMIELNSVTIEHFGARSDGVTDDIESMKRMHAWSRGIDATFGPGIVLGPGLTAISSWDLGNAEIPAFKLRGPEVAYGRLPRAQLRLLDHANAYAIRFKARRMEVANLNINGAASTKGFLENTVTRGDYCRIHAIQARGMTGRVFHVFDTIDTKLDQCYSSQGKASFFRTDWSNESPGAWDHPTAIEISNSNFEGHTGEFAVSCIRAGQSEMNNVWFDRNERGFDISQGGWVLKNVTQENSVNPSGAKYTKLTRINCRFEQGAGLSFDVSGYDPSWDPSGKPPTWVTNAMDQGTIQLDPKGSALQNGLAMGFQNPLPEMRLLNNTGNEKWINVGRVIQNSTLGATFELELQGAAGYDNIGSSTNHPGSTGFGGGRALIRGQLKYNVASADGIQLSWHGEGACPIREVRYVHAWQSFDIYVRMGAFTRVMGVFLRSDGVGRISSGSPFYYRAGSDAPVDIGSVANLKQAHKVWAVNGGIAGTGENNTGLGMDLDSGTLLLASPEEGAAAGRYLHIKNNYQDRYIPVQATMESTRVNRYAKADLPRADGENAYGVILCTDSGTGSGASTRFELLFSDGLKWVRAKDGSAVN